MTTAVGEPVGGLLRQWRMRRRLSQQQLAVRADVSTRHLSCLETGKAQPTAAMIDRLADQLDVPLRERNRLLLAGGYAPRYGQRSLDDRELAPVLDALRAMIDAHRPFPALLLDDHWDLIDANDTAYGILGQLCEPALLEPPVNLIRLTLADRGLGRHLRNRDRLAGALLARVRARADRTGDIVLQELAKSIVPYADSSAATEVASPVIAVEMEIAGDVLRFFTVGAQLETATDATLAELHLETFLPADPQSHAWLLSAASV